MSKTPTDAEVEQVWNEFWVPLLYANGGVDMEQVKRELFDFQMVMGEVSKVYDYITAGKISKCTTAAHYVIDATEQHYARVYSPD